MVSIVGSARAVIAGLELIFVHGTLPVNNVVERFKKKGIKKKEMFCNCMGQGHRRSILRYDQTLGIPPPQKTLSKGLHTTISISNGVSCTASKDVTKTPTNTISTKKHQLKYYRRHHRRHNSRACLAMNRNCPRLR